ncbi:hypothetical protein N0V88_007419 [Collariella sp. IMI 366227]|nr:hypothetical protein N0V88_007419 [Collariella sp. IMI 366227]
MTTSYLDKEGNGLVFWPDDKTSPNYNKYQYSKDRPRITRLVKQLFFRLNQQQFRNNKYKHKDNSAGTTGNERGHSEQTPIVLDSIENSPTVSPSLKQSGAPSFSAGGAQLSGPDEGKPSVNFIYRVVLSRTPAALTERWTPRGRFQDKTLAELCRELPFAEADLQGLTFTIDSPCMKTVEHIPPGDEDIFASMKRYINREIRAWIGQQPHASAESAPPRLVLDILIERMGNENARGADVFDDLELDW